MKFTLDRKLDSIQADSAGLQVNANGISFYNQGSNEVRIKQEDAFRSILPGETLVWSSNDPEVKDISRFDVEFIGNNVSSLLITREFINTI